MAVNTQPKEVRIDIRTSDEVKRVLKNAADLLGTTVSAFIVQHAYESARKILSEHNALILAQKDAELFVSTLVNPPAANNALRKLLKGK